MKDQDNNSSRESNPGEPRESAELGQIDDFAPPRHWVGIEELEPGYWSAPDVREKRGQEFFEKPVEWLESVEQAGKGGMLRREFLTLMGASMAMAGLSCARRPVNKIIPYVIKPEEITPGVAEYYSTTCAGCSAACGVIAKNREGRPIKLEGNPDHPLNRGALCARGQASILSLYDPDRLRGPLVRSRTTGGRKDSTWESVDQLIVAKLTEIQEKRGGVRILTGVRMGPSTKRLISEFLKAFPNGAHIQYDPLEPEEMWRASELCHGTRIIPRYRFADAEVVLSLGADFLGTWLSPVEYAKDWVTRRKLDSTRAAKAEMSKLICFESVFSVTGANADERHGVRPGDELRLALALAHEFLVTRKRSVAPELLGQQEVVKALGMHKAEALAAELPGGLSKIREIADLLWDARGRSLVVAGSPHSRTPEALALQVTVNLLNSLLGNDGKTVDYASAVSLEEERRGYGELEKLIGEMSAGRVDVLIVQGANPAYALPPESGFAEALKRVPLVLVFSNYDDETARLSDYVLAESHVLEGWGDAQPAAGLHSLRQPLIAPIHSTRSFEDVLLGWAKAGKLKVTGISARVSAAEKPSCHDYLRENWRENLHRRYAPGKTFDSFWEETLKAGFAGQSDSTKGASPVRRYRTAALAEVPAEIGAAPSLSLVLYANVALYDGSVSNNPWLQELPHPLTAVTWDNYLSMSPQAAAKLGLRENDVVELTAGLRSVRIPVHIQPGLHPAVAAAALGYGRRAAGKVGDGAGVDLYPFARAQGRRISYAGLPVQIKKTGQVYKLASTQWHTVSENRPIINDITLSEFKKNPKAANHTDPHLRMDKVPSIWPKHEYKGQRWGMAIDLNACIGCGACMVACQAENNVPVVGRDQVRNSRQMHWLKIDRYYSGKPEEPEVIFQPMLCQHCENAPCETVCPVLATVHSDDGLNLQVYNRCVGTRYCQNNCPYKVRRFNYFDHWKSYEGTMNLAWNPDVTVRSRGVMEKCTFCTQRIRGARDQVKNAAGPGNDIPSSKAVVPDGGVQTACQQTCPTQAIHFGDINDPKSRVSKMRADGRAFRALEIQNTLPAISYLTKVRNNGAEGAESTEGAEGTDEQGGSHGAE